MTRKLKVNEKLAAIINDAIERHVFPGAVVAYIYEGRRGVLPFGRLTYGSDAPTVTEGTVYDVASVTKSVATASVVLKLVEDGTLSLDAPLIQFVPEISCAGREEIFIRHLLTFTAAFALPQRLSAYAAQGGQAVLDAIFGAPLQAPPGTKYVYSNAPAILLGLVVSRVTGKPLDVLADGFFYKPLGMAHTTFHPDTLQGAMIAPTEINSRGEVHGVVHDESAWALTQAGMVPGNAGLFSAANDLLCFSEMLLNAGSLNGHEYFKSETVAGMHTNQLASIGAHAGLGWDMARVHYMGKYFSPQTFGKSGFTGPMLLIDTSKNVALVLLTNRTYPQRPADDTAINVVRSALAGVLLAAPAA